MWGHVPPIRRQLLTLTLHSAEGLQHNVVLIRELNQNIARIVHLYKELSARCALTYKRQQLDFPPRFREPLTRYTVSWGTFADSFAENSQGGLGVLQPS